jgi:hypothetical protein
MFLRDSLHVTDRACYAAAPGNEVDSGGKPGPRCQALSTLSDWTALLVVVVVVMLANLMSCNCTACSTNERANPRMTDSGTDQGATAGAHAAPIPVSEHPATPINKSRAHRSTATRFILVS